MKIIFLIILNLFTPQTKTDQDTENLITTLRETTGMNYAEIECLHDKAQVHKNKDTWCYCGCLGGQSWCECKESWNLTNDDKLRLLTYEQYELEDDA